MKKWIALFACIVLFLAFAGTLILVPAAKGQASQNGPSVGVTNSVPPGADTIPYRPAVLPGKGLAQHPFLYTGEWDHRKKDQTIYLVRGGKVVWSYSIPIKAADGTLEE